MASVKLDLSPIKVPDSHLLEVGRKMRYGVAGSGVRQKDEAI